MVPKGVSFPHKGRLICTENMQNCEVMVVRGGGQFGRRFIL